MTDPDEEGPLTSHRRAACTARARPVDQVSVASIIGGMAVQQAPDAIASRVGALTPAVMPEVGARARRRRAAAVLAGVLVGGAVLASTVVAVVRDPLNDSPEDCQQRAEADHAVHQRDVVPLLGRTAGAHLLSSCDSVSNGGTTVVDTVAGTSHRAAVERLEAHGWERVDPTTASLGYSPGAVAYRTTISGDTVFAVADGPEPDAPAGSATVIDIWTTH